MKSVSERLQEVFNEFGLLNLRFGQTMFNFLSWHQKEYNCDVFYLSNDQLVSRFEEYLEAVKVDFCYPESGDPPRSIIE